MIRCNNPRLIVPNQKTYIMNRILIIALIVISNITTAQEPEVRMAIDEFFAAFHARDTVKLRAVISEKAILHSVSEKESGVSLVEEKISKFLQSIASIPKSMKFEEQLLSYEIKTDGSMAHVWTPYVFYINGKRSHSGVNSFQLYRENGKWKITYLIDTRRK